MYIETACPSFDAGMNFIALAAAIALSVKPCGSPLTALIEVTSPEREKTARNTTVP